MKVIVVALFVLFMSACSKDPLDGAIPECPELLSKERQAYVDEGRKRCEQARTIEEKMKSVGCGIREKFNRCETSRMLSGNKSAFDKKTDK